MSQTQTQTPIKVEVSSIYIQASEFVNPHFIVEDKYGNTGKGKTEYLAIQNYMTIMVRHITIPWKICPRMIWLS